jgi:hypothetical protein
MGNKQPEPEQHNDIENQKEILKRALCEMYVQHAGSITRIEQSMGLKFNREIHENPPKNAIEFANAFLNKSIF